MTSRVHSLRWALCFALALCFHVAGAAALLAKWNEDAEGSPNPPLIMVDLAPQPVAPTTEPNDAPPAPVLSHEEEPEPDPEPVKPVQQSDLSPPDVKPDVVLPPSVPKAVEKPKEKKVNKKRSVAAAPNAAEQRAERSAAPKAGTRSLNPSALPTWRSELAARLERYKRYPSEARGDSGTTQVAFRVDRGGGVHNARIARSSGSSVLDRETLSLVQRAQPFPRPPEGISDADLSITAPVRYTAR